MTREEANNKYGQLCAQLGDTEAKLMFLNIQRTALKGIVANLKQEISDLDAAAKEIQDDPTPVS